MSLIQVQGTWEDASPLDAAAMSSWLASGLLLPGILDLIT